jgi:predicted PurR-regulated permease PerM
MTVLAILTALGLYLLDVPYWLTFGVFTGAVAIIPFFGTLISSTLPALFVLGGDGVFGLSAGSHAVLVVILGFVIHIIEANLVMPMITARQVEIPPVLSIMAVLVVGRLFGVAGLPVAVPLLAVTMVLVRRVLINRVYDVHSVPHVGRERVLVLRVPAPDGGVLVAADPPLDVLRLTTPRRSA